MLLKRLSRSASLYVVNCAVGVILSGTAVPVFADGDGQSLDQATVVGKREVDEMPVTNFVRAEEAFAAGRAHAPDATLRFVVIPRDVTTTMAGIHLLIEDPNHRDLAPVKIALADDGSFTLPLADRAWSDEAMVRSNQPVGSLHWRPLVTTAGEPADTRRMGDLRLECEAKEAGRLNRPDLPFFARIFGGSSISECASGDEHFFIAPAALDGVTLDDGAKQLDIAADRVAESSSGRLIPRTYHLFEDGWRQRAYSPPLGDISWPDDTQVRFHFSMPSSTASNASASAPAIAPGS